MIYLIQAKLYCFLSRARYSLVPLSSDNYNLPPECSCSALTICRREGAHKARSWCGSCHNTRQHSSHIYSGQNQTKCSGNIAVSTNILGFWGFYCVLWCCASCYFFSLGHENIGGKIWVLRQHSSVLKFHERASRRRIRTEWGSWSAPKVWIWWKKTGWEVYIKKVKKETNKARLHEH